MVQAGTCILCERCGGVLPVAGPLADAHYCVGCGLYMGSSCWNSSALRCIRCAGAGANAEAPATKGLQAARRGMRDLRGVRSELLGVAAREAKATPRREEPGIERRLLTVRAKSDSEAVLVALQHVRAHDIAQRMRRELDAEMCNITAVWRPETEAPARHPRPSTLRRPTLRLPAWRFPNLRLPRTRVSPRDVTLISSVALPAAFIVLVVASTSNLLTHPGGPRGTGLPTARETARDVVAGGAPSPAPVPTTRPEPREAVHMAFDELIMGADVSILWDVIAGGGGVEVAPFPNAVDRSLRLMGSLSGDPTTLCHSIPARGQLLRVSVDLLISGEAGGTAVRLELDGGAVGLVVGDNGEVEIEPVGNLPAEIIAAAQWYRVVLAIDPVQETYRVTAIPRNGAAIEVPERSLPATWRSALSGLRLCISGPAVAGGELFLDNVTIESDS